MPSTRGQGFASAASPLRLAVAATILAAALLAGPAQASLMPEPDRILILKSQHVLQLMRGDEVLKSYPIAISAHPGPKRRKGDRRTPEGLYRIDGRTAATRYHLALHISYPGPEDVERAAQAGVHPGNAIFIHGMPRRFGHTDPVRFFKDWTNGCISVGNIAIEEIWQTVPDGTPVEIRP